MFGSITKLSLDLSRLSKFGRMFMFGSNGCFVKDSMRSLETGALDKYLEEDAKVCFIAKSWSKLSLVSDVFRKRGGIGIVSRAVEMSRRVDRMQKKKMKLGMTMFLNPGPADITALDNKWKAAGLMCTLTFKASCSSKNRAADLGDLNRTEEIDENNPDKEPSGKRNMAASIPSLILPDRIPARRPIFHIDMETLCEKAFTDVGGGMDSWLASFSVERAVSNAVGIAVPPKADDTDPFPPFENQVRQVKDAVALFKNGQLVEQSSRSRQHILQTTNFWDYPIWAIAFLSVVGSHEKDGTFGDSVSGMLSLLKSRSRAYINEIRNSCLGSFKDEFALWLSCEIPTWEVRSRSTVTQIQHQQGALHGQIQGVQQQLDQQTNQDREHPGHQARKSDGAVRGHAGQKPAPRVTPGSPQGQKPSNSVQSSWHGNGAIWERRSPKAQCRADQGRA